MKSIVKFILNSIFNKYFLLRKVDNCEKKVVLTFDDGPHITNTLNLLSILDEAKVKATFFLLGSEVKKYPSLAAEIQSKGHEIGIHSYSHQKISSIGIKQYRKEIEGTIALIYECTGVKPYLFRPPFGELNVNLIRFMFYSKLLYVGWTVDSEDSFNKDKEQLINVLKNKNIQGGDILLFHEDYETTIQAMPEIINYLKQSGFCLVTISELKGCN